MIFNIFSLHIPDIISHPAVSSRSKKPLNAVRIALLIKACDALSKLLAVEQSLPVKATLSRISIGLFSSLLISPITAKDVAPKVIPLLKPLVETADRDTLGSAVGTFLNVLEAKSKSPLEETDASICINLMLCIALIVTLQPAVVTTSKHESISRIVMSLFKSDLSNVI